MPGSATRSIGSDRYEANLSNPESIRELHISLSGAEKCEWGLSSIFLGISSPFAESGFGEPGSPLRIAHWTFNVLKEFQEDLETSAQSGGGWLLNLNGPGRQIRRRWKSKWGRCSRRHAGHRQDLRPRQSPKTSVKNIDVDLTIDANLSGARIVQELATDDHLVEVGLASNGRYRLKLKRNEAKPDGQLTLDKNSTVLVTGGAYGVTADVAKGLAERFAPRMILVGRSPLPPEEPATTATLDAGGLRSISSTNLGMKARSFSRQKSSGPFSDSWQSTNSATSLLSDKRDVRWNITRSDVRDHDAFSRLIDDLYKRFGKVDGVVHGGGDHRR